MNISTPARSGLKTAFGLLLAISLTTPLLAQKKLSTVSVTVGDLGNPFFVQIAHGAEAAAKKINPGVKFQSESSNYDVNNQTNQMDNFVANGANLILLNAADSKGIAPAVMRAKAAGVTVVAVDSLAVGCSAAKRSRVGRKFDCSKNSSTRKCLAADKRKSVACAGKSTRITGKSGNV